MNNKYQSKSRKKTPWDDNETLTESQAFISSVYATHYDRSHMPLLGSGESELINSYIPKHCPYCRVNCFHSYGYTRNRIKRYKCSECGRTFTVLTGTLFDSHKISVSEWIEFCINLFHHVSIRSDSRNNKNAITTSRFWLHKLFLVLEDYQKGIILKGTVYLDETYYTVESSDIIFKEDGKKKRGISRNKYCILTACDKDNVVCLVCGRGKPSGKGQIEFMKEHIEKGSHLIHDGENSHNKLIKQLDLVSEVHPTKETKGKKDKDNPMYPINHIHFLLKSILNAHSSFDREDLQSYLNLFSFIMNPPDEELEKVDLLVKWVLSEEKILRYREFYAKK